MRSGIVQGFGVGILGLCLTLAASGPCPAQQCVGDCNGDSVVRINELITGLNIELGGDALDACPAINCNRGGPLVYIDCLVIAVNNALNGCGVTTPLPSTTTPIPTPTPSPVPPELSLGLQVSLFPDQHQVAVVAALSHLGGSVVSYVMGCTAECHPRFFAAISFELTGPDGKEVILYDPCGPAALCPDSLAQLSHGDSLTQTLSVTGTAWEQHDADSDGCYGTCTQVPLADGHYVVTASFYYRIGTSWAAPQAPALIATAGFDWPPAASPDPSQTAT